MAKVSSLIEVLRLGGSYGLVYRLWTQFTLSAVRVNVDVTWSRDEVLVSSYTFAPYILRGLYASNLFTVSVHHPEWDVSADSVSLFQLGQITRELQEEGDKMRVFFRTWDVDTFKRVCVATLDRYSSDPHQEISVLGRIVDALGSDVSVASINSCSTVLVEAFCDYLGSGYRQKLNDYPVFDLRLFRRCLQRTASSVFGSLNGLAMNEFIVNRSKGAQTRD